MVEKPTALISELRKVLDSHSWERVEEMGFECYADSPGFSRDVYMTKKWVLKTFETEPSYELKAIKQLPLIIRPDVWQLNEEFLLMPRYRYTGSERCMKMGIDIMEREMGGLYWDSYNTGNWAWRNKNPVIIDGWGMDIMSPSEVIDSSSDYRSYS